MSLRNKKTGEIADRAVITVAPYNSGVRGCRAKTYRSVDELNEEWEDCKPTEPLIKDEKIRKAVRAWADANDITQVSHDAGWNAFRCTDFVIGFDYDFDRHDGLKDMGSYTIAELCGEEEE